MLKGTTPTHVFNVGLNADMIDEVKITYSQHNKVILSKSTRDCTIEDGKISVKLSQEDTFLFDHNSFVEVQVRILTPGGEVLASVIMTAGVGKCLDDEVLT